MLGRPRRSRPGLHRSARAKPPPARRPHLSRAGRSSGWASPTKRSGRPSWCSTSTRTGSTPCFCKRRHSPSRARATPIARRCKKPPSTSSRRPSPANPQFVDAYHTLAEIHLKRKDKTAAAAVLKDDLKANPKDAPAASLLIEILAEGTKPGTEASPATLAEAKRVAAELTANDDHRQHEPGRRRRLPQGAAAPGGSPLRRGRRDQAQHAACPHQPGRPAALDRRKRSPIPRRPRLHSPRPSNSTTWCSRCSRIRSRPSTTRRGSCTPISNGPAKPSRSSCRLQKRVNPAVAALRILRHAGCDPGVDRPDHERRAVVSGWVEEIARAPDAQLPLREDDRQRPQPRSAVRCRTSRRPSKRASASTRRWPKRRSSWCRRSNEAAGPGELESRQSAGGSDPDPCR